MPTATLSHPDFTAFLPALESADTRLREAIEHALRAPGSLTRYHLTEAVARAAGLAPWKRAPLAVAIEFFHLASLLLDDLPSMDDAGTRRGQPCTHRIHGEPAAILAALAFINRAYTLLFEVSSDLPREATARAREVIDQCLGAAGVLKGQSMDLHFAATARDAASVIEVARLKTGSLLRLCLVLPAVMAAADDATVHSLESLSEAWGIAYQIADDLNDVLASSESAGKSTQRDAQLARPNLALTIGVPGAAARLGVEMEHADGAIADLTQSGPAIAATLRPFHEQLRGRFNAARQSLAVA